ncbi:DNA adenine methyltransferase YhdJ [Sedimentisphaera cyanobacteriorum]|uniref:Methyltransferase n=1 Tax=Sedimentisphaera cyanobacteriorum TaxID=1940790 RepID=A0A1Q2HPP1_9BACT|nr:site-specific DNA-methyltransferase [Sedimentisphaera cyanobacteriorum]AQQ09203.1 DNA adenine methyltransferase YhdJ [Sedimentisphaera cyanobacteriorum]
MGSGTKTSSFGTSKRINHDSSGFYNSKIYSNLSKSSASEPDNEFPSELLNTVIKADAQNMKEIPDNSLHLMITSPPYNVSKDYDDNLDLDEYLALLKNVYTETYRVLVNGGRACVNIANIGRKPYIPLSDFISRIMLDIGFKMRGEIIWNKGSGAGVSMAWGSWKSASNPVLRDVHEYILVFSKGDFKRPKKDKENTISKEDFMEWTKSVWNMNTESAKRVGHPAPFPEELPRRLIELYSYKEDIILDPFMGSGTTALAALKTDRKYVGYEVDQGYADVCRKRIDKYKQQRKEEDSRLF